MDIQGKDTRLPSAADVVIVGAGPAGTAAAITLSRSGYSVVIADRRTRPLDKFGEATPPAAVALIERLLGPLNDDNMQRWGLEKTRGNIAAWGNAETETTDFYFTTVGFGLAVDRSRFDPELISAAEYAGATFVPGTSLQGCRRTAGGQWSVQLAHAGRVHEINAHFIIDASGRSQAVCRALGSEILQADLLFAVGQYWTTSQPDRDSCTRIEAVEEGWWYSQRLPRLHGCESVRRVVFHTDRDLPVARKVAQPLGFARLLGRTKHIAPHLAEQGFAPSGGLRGACASSMRSSQFAGDGWLAVGDAAQALDPLSSQGITRALETGIDAGRRIGRALSDSQRARSLLKEYAQLQARDWLHYMAKHQAYYQSQPRWLDRPFWQRRMHHQPIKENLPLRDVS